MTRVIYGNFETVPTPVIPTCNYIIEKSGNKKSGKKKTCGIKAIKFYIWTDPWSVSFISRCENHLNYQMTSLEQSQEITYEEALVLEVMQS
jgi:hypothetical protein